MEEIEQISATELSINIRDEAVATLKKVMEMAKEGGKNDIINLIKQKNNPILNAALS